MLENPEVTIRAARISDIKNLKKFFIKAYGEDTVFQDENFLLYYFNSGRNSEPLGESVVAINNRGEIVSHYGGIYSEIILDSKIISLVWGVNAFTLPEYRGKGLNNQIVDYLQNHNEANAVIGMPSEAPAFYKKLGYTIFDKDTLDRFVYVLDEQILDIVRLIGQDIQKAKQLLPLSKSVNPVTELHQIVSLTKENFANYTFDLAQHGIYTTNRTAQFLDWRLFSNPYIDYKIYGYNENGKITSYVAVREETLIPTSFTANRIIDLFGKDSGVNELLRFVIHQSKSEGQLYIDFSMYGNLYHETLQSNGFYKLQNEDVSLLPQVSAPVANRPNHEFIVIRSKKHENAINALSRENVYFTRIDGDRDRINKRNQINSFS